jgi:HSP20 family protein
MTTEAHIEKRGGPAESGATGGPVYIPAVDIYEKEDAVLLRCDMPGVSDQKLEITVEDGVLTVEGVQEARIPEGFTCLTREYGRGTFKRSFRLADDIDESNIAARMKNGVLDVELPRSEKVKPRKIKIEVS